MKALNLLSFIGNGDINSSTIRRRDTGLRLLISLTPPLLHTRSSDRNFVIVMIDENFYYEDGLLKSKAHPNWNYLYHQMLFQEVTRGREKLAIIVLGDPEVFSYLLKMKTTRTAKED